ncbi:MAG TPA: hypothetical protein PK467_19055, partial [Candidatus Wallbacteria bacterium]|nr:hypothetical protein [Candidatus Wallbacteria bacterium]
GAVRDIIFGNVPNDYDILTDARCSEIAGIFKSVVPYGMKHGTVLVVIGRTPYDVTSYNDGEPAPLSLENDLAIRDFTINAMACDLNGLELIDLFGGLEDYAKKQIKCVVSAEARFKKDPLRILRAVRQAAKFGFEIEDATFESAKSLSHLITAAAPERIMNELVKLFDSPQNGKYLRCLLSINAWHEIFHKYYQNVIFPGCEKKFFTLNDECYKIFDENSSKRYGFKLALLIIFSLYRAAGDKIRFYEYKKLVKALFELKFSKNDFDEISALVFLAYYQLSKAPRCESWHGDIIKVKEAMIDHRELTKQKIEAGEVFSLCSLFGRSIGDSAMEARFALAVKTSEKAVTEKHPVYIEDLDINGDDIKRILGMEAGNCIGEALRYARSLAVADPACNRKEFLKNKIAQFFKKD